MNLIAKIYLLFLLYCQKKNRLLLCIQNTNFKNSNFYEDSIFRLGVSYYGAENFELSKKTFNDFVEKFTSNNLASEAY